jgi:hypothetical protein
MLAYAATAVVCLVAGAMCGVLWGRKHPATVSTVVDAVKKVGG